MHLPRRLAAPLASGALLIALLPHTSAAPAARAAAAPTATPAALAPSPAPDPVPSPPSFARGTLAKRPYAVMLDNHPNAYPQTGLDSALVVFEALANLSVK